MTFMTVWRLRTGYNGAVYRHSIDVRYGDCDMQGVVFNAHYLAYADDAVTRWLAATLPGGMYVAGNDAASFDFMVKKASVTWIAGLKFPDTVDLDCAVTRWGRTSFDVTVTGTVAGSDRFVVELVYVSVTPGTHSPCPVPDDVRSLLS
jgi:acyl-CoA thioester hydrolase